MFDEEYEELFIWDDNYYIFGRVSWYNVVIVGFLEGYYGIVCVICVLIDFCLIFFVVDCCFLVGIGGGFFNFLL